MKATIRKISDVTENNNVILTIGVEEGVVEVFGVKKPRINTYLMAIPAENAAKLKKDTVDENFNLKAFEKTKRTWVVKDGPDAGTEVTNTWLH